jgi:hypothetical protein
MPSFAFGVILPRLRARRASGGSRPDSQFARNCAGLAWNAGQPGRFSQHARRRPVAALEGILAATEPMAAGEDFSNRTADPNFSPRQYLESQPNWALIIS